MRKASSLHKRFTATYTISMEGKMYKPHLISAKLQKNPKIRKEDLVAVNKPGKVR
jgi:hypothetical protein